MQVLKLYAWELSFQDKVNAVRLKELETIKRLAYFSSVNTFFWTTAPVLVIYSMNILRISSDFVILYAADMQIGQNVLLYF